MKLSRNCNLTGLMMLIIVAIVTASVRSETESNREYRIKTAFLYNFIKFIDWPKEKIADNNEPITIGIIGKDPFGDAFVPLKNKQLKSKKVAVKRFKSLEKMKKADSEGKQELDKQIEMIRKCHLLFICSSEQENLGEIINLVKEHNVLTVAEVTGFLKAGGIINLLMEEEKVRFEINASAARKAGLKVSSELLRLAKEFI